MNEKETNDLYDPFENYKKEREKEEEKEEEEENEDGFGVFGGMMFEEEKEEEDDVFYIQPKAPELNIAKYVYELVHLGIPIRMVKPECDDFPKDWDGAVEKFSEDSLQAYGIVPWHIQTMLKRLTKAFLLKRYSGKSFSSKLAGQILVLPMYLLILLSAIAGDVLSVIIFL